MRRTRTAYHYAVRDIKKNTQDIVRQKFAEACFRTMTVTCGRKFIKYGGRGLVIAVLLMTAILMVTLLIFSMRNMRTVIPV